MSDPSKHLSEELAEQIFMSTRHYYKYIFGIKSQTLGAPLPLLCLTVFSLLTSTSGPSIYNISSNLNMVEAMGDPFLII